MKKIIILLLVILLCGCSAEKPVEILSSMQTKPTAETTIAETATPEETPEPISKETVPVIEPQKTETTMPSVGERPEQKPVPETSTATTAETPVVPIKAETTTKPPATPITPVETVKEDKPTELPETVETPSESVTEPSKAEFDVNYWINFARSYALQIGLEIDETAVDCWTTRQPPMPTAFILSGI